jgi:hypothetical protein
LQLSRSVRSSSIKRIFRLARNSADTSEFSSPDASGTEDAEEAFKGRTERRRTVA